MRFRDLGVALCRGAWGFCCLVAIGIPAMAGTDEEIFRQLRLEPTSPGARAMGLGGAFVALADDPTAAAVNPAGLRFASQPDFMITIMGGGHDPVVNESQFGSLEVAPATGARNLPYLSLTSASDPGYDTVPSFLSAVWPFQIGASKRRLVAGLSREVVVSSDRVLEASNAETGLRVAYDTFPNTVVGDRVEAYSVAGTVDGRISTEAVHWNASASFDLHPDFTIGATVAFAEIDLESCTTTVVSDPLELILDPSHPRLPAQPASASYASRINDSDSDWGWIVGVLWHPDSLFADGRSPWRFGAAFRKGARFSVREQPYINDATAQAFDTRVVEPDRYNVGASFRFDPAWRVVLEAERIEYSDTLEGFQPGVNFLTGAGASGFFPVDPDRSVRFEADDAFVPRLGVEYGFKAGAGARFEGFASAGWYRAADGSIHLEQFNAADPEVEAAFLEAFSAGEDESHVTLGGGVAFDRYYVHAGGDIWDGGYRIAVSLGARLGAGR